MKKLIKYNKVNTCRLSTMSMENIPVLSYLNTDIDNISILEDNANKTGIYKWTNKLTEEFYIGSAINLKSRFKNYYNISFLEREIKSNKSIIYKSLLKYGYSNFKLDILDYCSVEQLISREQYYLNTLNSKYNILKPAGSLLVLNILKLL